MKKVKLFLIIGGALLVTGAAIANYLMAQPKEPISELTLANIEAMGLPFMDFEDEEIGLFRGTCSYVSPSQCSVTCPRCHQITYAYSNGSGKITGGYCSNCFYIPYF